MGTHAINAGIPPKTPIHGQWCKVPDSFSKKSSGRLERTNNSSISRPSKGWLISARLFQGTVVVVQGPSPPMRRHYIYKPAFRNYLLQL